MTAATVAIAIWMLWPGFAQGPAVKPWIDKFDVRKADQARKTRFRRGAGQQRFPLKAGDAPSLAPIPLGA